MSARGPLLGIAAARAAYGFAAMFASPAIFSASRLTQSDDSRYLNALFGGRDITVAALTVAAVRAGREREAVLANASCEATDLLALIQEVRQRGQVDAAVRLGIVFNLFGWLGAANAARALRG